MSENKIVYMGGHLLNQAMVEFRERQHKEVAKIEGVQPYSNVAKVGF